MQFLRSARWFLLALFVTLISISSHAQISISASFAPPPLPVYEQPPCPEPGLMWTPGYWAFDQDLGNYYWVAGAWVPAPRPGLLWTPGYWGWSNGRFFFHEGYWSNHVGYYGGVNYGFGYGGIGFAGGEWRGDRFFYNTAVIHLDFHNHRFGGAFFEDRGRVERGYAERDSHIAFSGGPGGIRHDPRPEERFAEHERHMDRSPFQHSHEQDAHRDRNSFYHHDDPHHDNDRRDFEHHDNAHPDNAHHDNDRRDNEQHPSPRPDQHFGPGPQQHQEHPAPQQHSWPNQQPQQRPAPPQQQPQQHQAPQQQHPAPQQQRPAPQQQPQQHQAPQQQPQQHGGAQSHPAPDTHPAPKDEHKHN